MLTTDDIIARAAQAGLVVPAFNVPYLPMVEPVIRATVRTDCFALAETARLDMEQLREPRPGGCHGRSPQMARA